MIQPMNSYHTKDWQFGYSYATNAIKRAPGDVPMGSDGLRACAETTYARISALVEDVNKAEFVAGYEQAVEDWKGGIL
jgi:hypothetical protein